MSLGESSKSLIKLAIPIIMGQIGLMLIGAGDVFIASLYSKTSVAAIGVANGVINPVFLFGLGL
jgi:MATE family multidrug resistance protein